MKTNIRSRKLARNVASKEAPARADASKPWIAAAVEAGRQVPQWMADLPTREEFERMMDLRERAFPQTRRTTH